MATTGPWPLPQLDSWLCCFPERSQAPTTCSHHSLQIQSPVAWGSKRLHRVHPVMCLQFPSASTATTHDHSRNEGSSELDKWQMSSPVYSLNKLSYYLKRQVKLGEKNKKSQEKWSPIPLLNQKTMISSYG